MQVSPAAVEGLIAWIEDGQRRLRASVDALTDDAELVRPRKTNWGEIKETRWIVKSLIEHDLYHAGEINRMRALRQQKRPLGLRGRLAVEDRPAIDHRLSDAPQ